MTRNFIIAALAAAICAHATTSETSKPKEDMDRWAPVRVLLGDWEGETNGQPGHGKASRHYRLALNDHFVEIHNQSVYPPQEKNPQGETHRDIGFFSYDKINARFVLRQFHSEGFVNEYTSRAISDDRHLLIFESDLIENIPPGWRAREQYRIVNADEFVETFSLAEPGKDFQTYSETHFHRKK